MPIAYLDVHEAIEIEQKKVLVKGIAGAMQDAYPFGDHLAYVREWPSDSMSQDGQVGWKRPRLVFQFLGPRLAIEVKRKLMKDITAAVADAFSNPPDLAVFLQEYLDDQVGINGILISDRAAP
jgi:phenylpyruvate tautomerase PptA (4-oxalocrotonate tautomerase family)